MDRDIYFMKLAIEEAKKGLGRTSPNPCVGAVIVRDDRVLATGYHQKAGDPHAERNAIAAAIKKGESLQGATIYVTLEPCSHIGRTPPCCEALIGVGLRRAVIGMIDPNPVVNSRGIAWLRQAGMEVISGVLEKECYALNRPFFKHITTGQPWVIMKAGVSLDGRLNYQHCRSGWITNTLCQRRVHHLRDTTDAILVGATTVAVDDPSLTTRLTLDEEEKRQRKGRDPLRVVLDGLLNIPLDAKMLHQKSKAETVVFCHDNVSSQRRNSVMQTGAKVFAVANAQATEEELDEQLDLPAVLSVLGQRGICSVMVEGGGRIHGAFLRAGLFDEAYLFYGSLFAGDKGTPLVADMVVSDREQAPLLYGIETEMLGTDFLVHGFFSPL